MALDIGEIEISEPIPLLDVDPSGKTFVQFQRPARWETERIVREATGSVELIFGEGDTRQRNYTPSNIVDSIRVGVMLIRCDITREKKPLFVPGKNLRRPRGTFPSNLETEFLKTWWSLPDPICVSIINAMRQWHPPYDWTRPERGEDQGGIGEGGVGLAGSGPEVSGEAGSPQVEAEGVA